MSHDYDNYLSGRGFTTGFTTIAAGEEFSGEIKSHGKKLMAVSMPSGWDAGSMSFQAKTGGVDSRDFQDLYDETAEVALYAAANRTIFLPDEISDMFAGLSSFRFRSGLTGGSVSQSSDRIIGFSLQSP